MNRKRIVLLVEGEGDVGAARDFAKRLLAEQQAFDCVILDENPLRVGELPGLAKNNFEKWRKYLGVARKRGEIGGVLLLVDGDADKFQQQPFCAATAAAAFASAAREVGAGQLFSLAVVFALCEFESWLIGAMASLDGKLLPDGRRIGPLPATLPPNPEAAPRDAKGWLSKVIEGGYKETRDQHAVARLVELKTLREQGLRSFRRLENAIGQLVAAIRTSQPVATPTGSAPSAPSPHR